MSERETHGRGYVVVGLDSHGQRADLLTVAADEAERRGADLAIVTVLRPHLDAAPSILVVHHEQRQAEALALQDLHEAAASLHPSHPQLSVTTYCLGAGEIGPSREPLLWAELLVIGTQSHLGGQALPHESVSRLLLTSSRCPLLIVPDSTHPVPTVGSGDAPPILVGVSEHPTDDVVVRAAFAESVRHGCEVLLLHAYSLRPGETPERAADRARAVLAGFAAQAPAGTHVSMVITDDEPAAALFRRARHVAMLVIGGRTGPPADPMRGSVSRAVLKAVPCPILAVPRNLAEERPSSLAGITVVRGDDREPAFAQSAR